MRKKALIIGINDYNTINDLQGCHNDVTNIRHVLLTYFGFSAENISLLVDSSATKDRIRMRMKWLFAGLQSGDHAVFHFSGHGSYIRDFDGDEQGRKLKDDADELICLYDMDWRNKDSFFIDDELREWTQQLPKGAQLTVILDSCHSGGGTRETIPPPELAGARGRRITTLGGPPYSLWPYFPAPPTPWDPDPIFSPPYLASRFAEPPLDIRTRSDERKPGMRSRFLRPRAAEDMNHMLLAACRDDQSSADARIGGDYHGAFTYYFCKTIREGGHQLTYVELVEQIRHALLFNQYDQVPQCEGPRASQRVFT